jgi:phosphoribosylanthranilate isomerase
MGNTFKIKVCGMRDTTNLQELIKLKPDFIGLIFYTKSKRFVPDDKANEIVHIIPKEIEKVGVFVNELASEMIRKINLFGLDFVQLHGDESPRYCQDIKSVGIKTIKAFGIDNNFDFSILSEYEDSCDYFLFDTKDSSYGGTGKKFDWSKLQEYMLPKPFFLSGGIGISDIERIKKLENIPIHSIDVNSKFETAPALKNIPLLEDFFTRIRE